MKEGRLLFLKMTREETIALVDQCVSKIREHAESVRIFATFETQDGQADTRAYDSGAGNYYAQKGQILEWLEIERLRVKRQLEEDEGD
jgi:hypothetical protein